MRETNCTCKRAFPNLTCVHHGANRLALMTSPWSLSHTREQDRALMNAGFIKGKFAGRTFTAKANRYGNVYGYQGSKKVAMFFGDYLDQIFDAREWLALLSKAASLTQ